LRGWRPPYSTHPPFGKLVVALGVRLFGDCPWGWRAANALIGAALAPITYLLARKLFRSRLAASIAAILLLCEGMFLVASRLAMINIVYITTGAGAYLMLWRFVREPGARTRRIDLAAMSVLLGLCVSTKAAISEVTVLLAMLVVVVTLLDLVPFRSVPRLRDLITKRVIGACGLIVGIVLLIYLAVFMTYYWAVWRGIGDVVDYHAHVFRRNFNLPADFPNASPFWSWPLLLHPYAYWRKVRLSGTVVLIWCGGNPLIWWGVLPAIPIALIRGYTRNDIARIFLVLGYIAYLAMWIPLRRYVFIYSYMPALYLGLLAVAGALEQCWSGEARRWEHLAMLAPLLPCLILGMGVGYGGLVACVILIAYLVLGRRAEGWDGKFVCVIFTSATVLLFMYLLPLWTGIPLSEAGYKARIWLNGRGLANWQ
jgi:dolichyl-phosphate-mannose--protein O-mannosyl transferase